METLRKRDIVIIGSGASGGAVMWNLAKNNYDVLCLEQGDWVDPNTYATNSKDWQFLQKTKWSVSPNIRKLPVDYQINEENSEISVLMYNAVGGSTIHWTAHAPRFHPSDFRVKTLDGVADDWPITYFDLEKYYDLNDIMMGCSGINGDPANPQRSPRPMKPLPLGKDGELLARAFDKLGWHWWPSDSYINSENYNNRSACNNCGPTALNCSRGARASTDITYIPQAQKLGAELRTNCTVNSVIIDDTGRAKGVNYFDINGNKYFQPANAVILACNGIGTPRILLNSKSGGLANSSGLVGKNLMFHPYAGVQGVFPSLNNKAFMGPLANIIMSQEFYETNRKNEFKRGYSFQINRSNGPALTAINYTRWGENHHKDFDNRFGNILGLGIIGDDLPEKINCVEIDNKITDKFGIPSVRVNYRLSQNSKKLLAHGVKSAKKLLKSAGATEIFETSHLKEAGWHLMGTAKMGNNPKSSVVNKYGQTHDIDNLFIVDGSVFVTAGAVNPTPTIQAFALWSSQYIINNRQDLKS